MRQNKERVAILIALIGAGGAVLAALITVGIPYLFSPPPPIPGPESTSTVETSMGTNSPPPAEPSTQTARTPAGFPFPLDLKFAPSGWMGDGEAGKRYLRLETVNVDVAGERKAATRIEYRRGPKGWAGVYWQCPDGNWGTQAGTSLEGATAISFLARGEVGGELVEFKSGGIRGTHSDSYVKSLGKVTLRKSWTPYRIRLSGLDLSSAIGAFAWSAPARGTRMRFYIADLQVE